ncbi:MAG: aminotransferase class V-fold PLP-dependent enzyme [Promethearchaeota archaeon]|jgi:selenocysteine lyase/cysteine desulfurase
MENFEEKANEVFAQLKNSVYKTLETYSNVHRGTGHNSMITTALFDRAREIFLEYLHLDKKKYSVVFCSPRRLNIFKTQLKPTDYQVISSKDFNLSLGIRALVAKKKSLRKCPVIYTGGGMIKHVTFNSVVWADIPERFEAGTPSTVNIITLAIAIQLTEKYGKITIKNDKSQVLSPTEILYQDDDLNISGKDLLFKLKKLLIGYKIFVPTREGLRAFINLDNAASTPTFLPIWDTYCKALKQPEENSQEIINEVKKICSNFLNAPLEKYDIIFTSNTTEAINFVAQSLNRVLRKEDEPVIINTILEHHSNELPFRYISNSTLIRIAIDDEGFIDLNELETILKEYNRDHKHGNKRVKIVGVSGVSNVLGTYTDLQSISRLTHKYNAYLLVDGAQVVAHHKVDIDNLNIDYFAFSGHKNYAPFGSGALIVKKGLLKINDNELDEIYTSGEENVVGIATMGKAIFLLNKVGIEHIEEYEKGLTERTLKRLNIMKDVEIFGVKDPNSSSFNKRGSIVAFSLKTVPHNLAAKELAEYGGIGIRNGCFCAHILIQQILKIQKIRTLGAAMTSIIIPEKTRMCLPGTLRVSFGIENDETEVDTLLNTIEILMNKPRSQINTLLAYTYNGTLFIPKTKTEEKMKTFVKLIIRNIFSNS